MGSDQRADRNTPTDVARPVARLLHRVRSARVNAVRATTGAAIALTVLGAALRLAPTPHPNAHATLMAAPAALEPSPPTASAGDVTSYASIVRENIFSPERSAPRRRLYPQGTAVAVAPTDSGHRRPALRLYGITVAAQGAIALIDADPSIPGAEIYRVDDLVAGARLVAITDSTVTLAEPSGPLILRLHLAPRRKP